MRRASVVLALATAGCTSTHTLPRPARLPSPQGACSIGVASVMDETGVDHALDLRDYLRAHGPCRKVMVVVSVDDNRVDLVVSGKVSAQLTPPGVPPVFDWGGRILGAGLGLAIAGAVSYGVAAANPPPADGMGFVNPSSRASQRLLQSLGVIGLGVGGVIGAGGVALMITDAKAIREVSLDGHVDVEVTVLREGRPVAELHEHDDVTARGKQAAGRPEPRTEPAAAGPLYREVMARVFEHIAARLAETLEAGGQSPAPPR